MKMPCMLIAAIAVSFIAACTDGLESLSPDSGANSIISAGDLTFTLQLLDMQGIPQNRFNEGENFQFQFIIENSGKDNYTLPVPWDFPIVEKDFFAVYQKTQESGGTAYLGKYFRKGNNFRDLRPEKVPGRGAISYTLHWMIDEDAVYILPERGGDISEPIREYIKTEATAPQLKIGEYFTGFTMHYTESDSVRLEVSFVVK